MAVNVCMYVGKCVIRAAAPLGGHTAAAVARRPAFDKYEACLFV